MSIPAIEIATAIHTALRALTWPESSPAWAVYARGVPTDIDGVPKAEAVESVRRFPFVDIIVGERVPAGHGSAIRAFGLIIRVVTHQPQDQFQAVLYAGADVLANWACSRPVIAPAGITFDAIFFDAPPNMVNFNVGGGDNQFGQIIEWNAVINTRTT